MRGDFAFDCRRRVPPAYVVLLQKGWQSIAGLITLVLVTHFLSPLEQGYYYAIGGLLSGYLLLDLGLAGLLVQIAARMYSGLEITSDGRIVPEGAARSAFLDLVRCSTRWYRWAGLTALILAPIGFQYFSQARPEAPSLHWQWPWLLAVVFAVCSLQTYPALSIIEGSGRVAEVYWVRLGHYSLGALLAWFSLSAGAGLYAPAMAPLSMSIVIYGWAYLRYRALFVASNTKNSNFLWRREIWPLQRKVALTSMASYLFLNSPTLIVFYFADPVRAGQLGLSSVVANLLGSLCASWLIAKVPQLTHLAAQGSTATSRVLFFSEFKKAFLLMSLSYSICLLVSLILSNVSFSSRILPTSELLLLFTVFLLFHSIGMFAVYFRAQKREELAVPLLLATIVSLSFACLTINSYGVVGVLGSFLATYVPVLFLLSYMVWKIGVET